MFSGNDDVCEVNVGQFVSKTQQNIEENMKKGDGSGDKCLHMNINVTAYLLTSWKLICMLQVKFDFKLNLI